MITKEQIIALKKGQYILVRTEKISDDDDRFWLKILDVEPIEDGFCVVFAMADLKPIPFVFENEGVLSALDEEQPGPDILEILEVKEIV